ncbi:MAG: hypothetical protein H7836_10535 [Magnetococcus sp. YQC-3]
MDKPPPIPAGKTVDPKSLEKPLIPYMQRLLAGKPTDDLILDPDNPNLILERREKSSN